MLGLVADARPKLKWVQAARSMPKRRPTREERYADGGIEPQIEDLLTDPVTEAIMRCDRVSVLDLRTLVEGVRSELRGRVPVVRQRPPSG